MSSQTDGAATGSSPWPARSGVSRTELDPDVVPASQRDASTPTASRSSTASVRRTYAELRERVNRLASALRARGLEHHDRVAALCPNVPELLELHHAVPAAGGVLVAINVRLSAGEVGYILEHSGARVLFVDPELEPLAARGARRRRGRAARATTYERLLASGDPAGVAVAAARRGGADRDRLHLGHDRPPEGRRLHLPRRVPERARRGDRGRARPPPGLPVDAADVPLQRLVLPVGGDRGRRARTSACARSTRSVIWRLFREEGVTHYNGSPTVQIGARQPPGRRRRSSARVTALVAGAPPSPTLLGRMEALNIRDRARLRADRDLRPAHRVHVAGRLGRRCPPRSARACSPARARATRPPTSSAWSTTRCATCRATARRWARS